VCGLPSDGGVGGVDNSHGTVLADTKLSIRERVIFVLQWSIVATLLARCY